MDASRENRERWARFCEEDPSLEGMGMEVRHLWNAPADRFRDIAKRLTAPYDADEVAEAYMRAVISTETVAKLFPDATLGKTLLRLRRRLEDISIPHKHGGRVTVMQPLEARQIQAKAYIFLDFNDSLVPSDSIKDIFLDTEIRKESGLPIYRDREDLQRYYYELIFSRAERVAVAYRETESDAVSRLLMEFPVRLGDYDPVLLSSIAVPVAPGSVSPPFSGDVAIVGSMLDAPLSATRLKTFLVCPRKYYYRYVMNLKEPESHHAPFADIVRRNALFNKLFNHHMDISCLSREVRAGLHIETDRIGRFSQVTDLAARKIKFAEAADRHIMSESFRETVVHFAGETGRGVEHPERDKL